jgi:hypothetical protein
MNLLDERVLSVAWRWQARVLAQLSSRLGKKLNMSPAHNLKEKREIH